MVERKTFSKLFIRQGHPDFLDLPWNEPLSRWSSLCSKFIEVEMGIHRHEVVAVNYDGRIYVIKELPARIAEKEYRSLQRLENLGLPAVVPVGFAKLKEGIQYEERGIVITKFLESSLPFRTLFTKTGLKRYQTRLLGAIAVLLVRLHLKGFFWGDCSLSNTLFRRDAGELQAFLVDAETSENHPSLSDGQRKHDMMIMEENIAGDLMDVDATVKLDKNLDIFKVGTNIRRLYDSLWQEVTNDEVFEVNENYKIHERIKRINDLGFTVDEIELNYTDDEGSSLKMRPIVTDRNYHRHQLQNFTGISAEETQARIILNDVYELQADLSKRKNRSIPLSNAAFKWVNTVYRPAIKKLGLIENESDAPEVFCEVLEHKWFLSEEAKHDVGLDTAIEDFCTRFKTKDSNYLRI